VDSEVVRRVWQLLEAPLESQGYELVEVEYGRHGRGGLLRLFVDKPDGITLDDCAAASRMAGALLDEADFIQGSYTLEVSSPGFERPLRKPADFERFAGERVKIRTHTLLAGRKKFSGVLLGLQDGLIAVDCDGKTYAIHIENLHKAHLDR